MRQRYRLYRRKKSGRYYIHDAATGKQDSLHTADRATALRLLHARKEAQAQPAINLQIAKAYLAATDKTFVNRTWGEVMTEFVTVKTGSNRTRSERAVMDKAFDSNRDLELIETCSEHFLRVLELGKISTNNYLRLRPLALSCSPSLDGDVQVTRSACRFGLSRLSPNPRPMSIVLPACANGSEARAREAEALA